MEVCGSCGENGVMEDTWCYVCTMCGMVSEPCVMKPVYIENETPPTRETTKAQQPRVCTVTEELKAVCSTVRVGVSAEMVKAAESCNGNIMRGNRMIACGVLVCHMPELKSKIAKASGISVANITASARDCTAHIGAANNE